MYSFDQAAGSTLADLLTDIHAESDLPLGKRLLCAACGEAVTDKDRIITVHGAHEHTCANPHGTVFHIGCFSRAPGCAHLSPAREEDTWFAGYSWQLAICGQCGEHLGWYFRDPTGEGFHGLILARLVAEQ